VNELYNLLGRGIQADEFRIEMAVKEMEADSENAIARAQRAAFGTD
jgi:hypothetical protein